MKKERIFYVRMDEKDSDGIMDEFKTPDLGVAIKKLLEEYLVLKKRYLSALKYAPFG